jgi:hypothetical protein
MHNKELRSFGKAGSISSKSAAKYPRRLHQKSEFRQPERFSKAGSIECKFGEIGGDIRHPSHRIPEGLIRVRGGCRPAPA